MKKVLLLLTIAFLCSSCFSQAKRQSQAKTAKTQQSYPKRAPSYTSKGLITLPDAKFSDANLQTLYNNLNFRLFCSDNAGQKANYL